MEKHFYITCLEEENNCDDEEHRIKMFCKKWAEMLTHFGLYPYITLLFELSCTSIYILQTVEILILCQTKSIAKGTRNLMFEQHLFI